MSSFPETKVLGWEEIMSTHTTQSGIALGARGVTNDCRVFRYSKNGASALSTGCVVQTADPTLLAVSQSSGHMRLPAGTTITTTYGVLSISATNFSQDTAVTANTYKEGYIFVGSTGLAGWGTGLVRMLKIKSHTGTTAASTSPIEFTLEDGQRLLATVNTSNGYFGAIKNPYDSVVEVVSTAYPTGDLLGVPVTDVAANAYFWLQTWGPAVVELGTATTVAGSIVAYATDAAVTGAVVPTTATVLMGGAGLLGTLLGGGPAGGYATVFLKCAP